MTLKKKRDFKTFYAGVEQVETDVSPSDPRRKGGDDTFLREMSARCDEVKTGVER